MSNEQYKTLYKAQKIEHEKTLAKVRKLESERRLWAMSYEGAMADCEELCAVMRKHLLAMQQFMDLNFPKRKGVDHE